MPEKIINPEPEPELIYEEEIITTKDSMIIKRTPNQIIPEETPYNINEEISELQKDLGALLVWADKINSRLALLHIYIQNRPEATQTKLTVSSKLAQVNQSIENFQIYQTIFT